MMATVIKNSGAKQAVDAAAFAVRDLGDGGGDDLEGVRRQAAEILSGAEREAQAIRRRAEDQGRAAALEAAEQVLKEKVGRQLATVVPALGEAIDRIRGAKDQWFAHWEQTAVHVAAAIASRVIRREIERTPNVTLALVREALELAAGTADVQLRMHPDDLAALGSQVERLAEELARLGKPEILADPNIEKGGCRVETRFGAIDQQFAAQLARIEQELA